MTYKLIIATLLLSCCLSTNENLKSSMQNTGRFIMMPDNQEASFTLDLDNQQLTIFQNKKSKIISLQQAINYEDRYTAPQEKQLIKEKSKVLHISKNVFNEDDAIEVLVQLAYKLPNNDPKEFVIDLLVSEKGNVKLLGTTHWSGSNMGSHPVFAIIDDKAYYGIYDDRYDGLIDAPVGSFLNEYQRLNAIPHITETGFTNGTISYKKTSWKYAQEKDIPVEQAIQRNQDFITKLIGSKEDALTIQHPIYYNDVNNSSAETHTVEVKTVATYNDPDYNPRGVKSLMQELGRYRSLKVIPVLMNYVEDNRNIDVPGDDYGSTTIKRLATKALTEIFQNNPELLINFKEPYVSHDTLTKWWEKNKQVYE